MRATACAQARARVQELCTAAREAGKTNVAFLANFLLHDVDACVDILVAGGRLPEAALFARTYRPSRVPELVRLWQDDLRQVNAKAAESLASPEEYPNLFPDWDAALRIDAKRGGGRVVPAAQYAAVEGDTARDLIAEGAADAAPVRRSGGLRGGVLQQLVMLSACANHTSRRLRALQHGPLTVS